VADTYLEEVQAASEIAVSICNHDADNGIAHLVTFVHSVFSTTKVCALMNTIQPPIALIAIELLQSSNERQETVVAAMSIQLELKLFPSDSVFGDDQYLNKITLHSSTEHQQQHKLKRHIHVPITILPWVP